MVAVKDQALRVVGTDFSIQRPVVLGSGASVRPTTSAAPPVRRSCRTTRTTRLTASLRSRAASWPSLAVTTVRRPPSCWPSAWPLGGASTTASATTAGRRSTRPAAESPPRRCGTRRSSSVRRPDRIRSRAQPVGPRDVRHPSVHHRADQVGHLDRGFRTHIFRRLMTYQANASLTRTGRLVMSAARHGVRGDRNTVVRLTTHGVWTRRGPRTASFRSQAPAPWT